MSLGKPPLPVDKGWAWLIMIGSFINITIVISFNRASGLFVTELLDQFQESATSTTIAFGAAPFMFSLCNILLPIALLPRFCPRVLIFTGGVFSGISVTSMAFARSMLTMTFLFGIMGFSHGLIFVPQTVLIGSYFKKRLAFANAFAYMGMAAAAIFSPIVGRFLLDIYGLQGTLLLYGAFTFNILTSALLLRPISSYRTEPADKVSLPDIDKSLNEKALPLLKKESSQYLEHVETPSSIHYEKCHLSDSSCKSDYATYHKTGNNFHQVPENTNEFERYQGNDEGKTTQQTPNAQEPKDPSHDCECVLNFEVSSDDLLEEDKCLSHDNEPNNPKCGENTQKTCILNAAILQSSGDPDEPSVSYAESHQIDPPHINPKKSLNRCFGGVRARVRGSVYSNSLAILLLLAAGFCVHTQPSLTYLPSLGEENGLSQSQVPYLLTVAGIFNLLGKLIIGFVADLSLCNTNRLYIVAAVNMTLGGVFHFIRYITCFLCLFSVIFAMMFFIMKLLKV